jgi:hypothetical protein
MPIRPLLPLPFALALIIADAQAATFCVDTGPELQQALMTAASNGEADTVKVELGIYEGSSAVAFAYSSSQNFAVTVAGGYLPGCALQFPDPSLTELSGSDARQVLSMQGTSASSGAQALSNLTIRDGSTSQPGAGLVIGGGAGFSGTVSVSRVVFSRNVSTSFGGGMSLYSEGLVNILNNLFLLNRCSIGNCAFTATVNASSPTGFRAYFGNNTIVGNACTSGSGCSFTGARYGGSASSVFYNNVFAANALGDLALQNFSGGSTELYNNNVVSISGTPPALMAGNIAFANPQFVDLLNDDLRPTFDSPLRNAGISEFALLHQDLAGVDRVNEFRVDIGAYENVQRIFLDGFEFVE